MTEHQQLIDFIGAADRTDPRYQAWMSLRPQRGGWPIRSHIRAVLIRTHVAHAWRVFRRVLRALRQLATDKRLPRWLRVLLIIGCVQIPVLPIDEIALVAALAIIGIWYRAPLVDALATVRGRSVTTF